MIFLNPAVLFGLLAASIPVLIHLFNLRKLKRIDFSTLSFLKELQKNKIRKIKLKQWLLLVLRVAIILFLVTAFARPTLKGIAIGGTTSAAKTTAVFILDNTFSMSVVDSKGSYFNQARSEIKQLTGQLQEGDDAALILVGSAGIAEIKTTGNLTDFNKQVDEAKISDISGYLNNAIVKAADIMSKSKNFNKELYILSDFQYNRLYEPNSLSNLGQLLNENVRIFGFDFAGKETYNLGLSDLKLNTQIFEQNKPIEFSATVSNYSSQSVNNLVTSLFINGRRSSQQSVSIGPGESKIINLEASVDTFGYIGAEAEIEDDDILQDNMRYLSFFIPEEIPLLILTDNPDDAKFVDLALNASDSGKELSIDQKNLSQIASIDFSKYKLAIIIGTSGITDADRISMFVKNGGGLMLMPGSSADSSGFKYITESLGIPSPGLTSGKINSSSNQVKFYKIDYNHPVFEYLYSKSSKPAVESPDIYYHFRYNTEGKGESIITLSDGSSFLSSFKVGKGKVFLFNTAPVLSWGNFPLKAIFAPLIYKSSFFLAAQNNNDNNFIAGKRAIIFLGNNVIPQIKIIRPDNTVDFINFKNNENSGYLEYERTDLTGNYKILAGNKIIGEFSVNTDPGESVMKYITTSDFENYLKNIDFKGKFINVGKNEDPSKIILQSRFGSELWQYFLFIALILALVEMAVARNAKKDLINPE